MSNESIMTEFKRITEAWIESGYQHYVVEGLNHKQLGFIRHPPKNLSIDDAKLSQLLMLAAFQHGGNWFFWFEKAKEIDNTIDILIETLSISYKRVLYRVLYALQNFDREKRNSTIQIFLSWLVLRETFSLLFWSYKI